MAPARSGSLDPCYSQNLCYYIIDPTTFRLHEDFTDSMIIKKKKNGDIVSDFSRPTKIGKTLKDRVAWMSNQANVKLEVSKILERGRCSLKMGTKLQMMSKNFVKSTYVA